MYLPPYILYCLDRLEQAGFATYAVGGCVRDALLGRTPHDYDLCTAATPDSIKELFSQFPQVLSGEKHGTIGIILDHQVVEITTFRKETAYQDCRHPDSVHFVTDIQEDLSRRDFTINAMAFSPTRGLADPFGGREDLEHKRLRAVGQPEKRFQEDALRILRGVRFAVRFDLTPEKATFDAMHALASQMDHLSRERVFDELCKILPQINAAQLSAFAPVLIQVLPELAPCLDFDQHSKHHAYDLYTHIAHVTEGVPPQLPLRWAALLHDIGKPQTFTIDTGGQGHFFGHAPVSAQMADAILRRLKAPNGLREQVTLLIQHHMTQILPEAKVVRRWMSRLGPDGLEQLLLLQEADMGSKGTGHPQEMAQFAEIRRLAAELCSQQACFSLKNLAVNGHDLMAMGFSGPAIGKALACLLEQVIDEQLPNEKGALLQAAKNL